MRRSILVFLSFTLWIGFQTGSSPRADELLDRMQFWREQAFSCKDVAGLAFPSSSKHRHRQIQLNAATVI